MLEHNNDYSTVINLNNITSDHKDTNIIVMDNIHEATMEKPIKE